MIHSAKSHLVCYWVFFICFALSLVSCASFKKIEPGEFDTQVFYQQACKFKNSEVGVEGNVWIRVKDHEETAQFPAQVRVLSEEDFYLEVSNLLGAAQATIEMRQERFKITDLRSSTPRVEHGKESWSGVPIRWIASLFLGRVPCPKNSQSVKIVQTQENEIEIHSVDRFGQVPERFTYRFTKWKNLPWLESMSWTQLSKPSRTVDFKLSSPSDDLGIPEKWEIKADQVELKVKWRSRKKI